MKVNVRTYQAFLKFIVEKNLLSQHRDSIIEKINGLGELTEWHYLTSEEIEWTSVLYNDKTISLPFLDEKDRFITKVNLDKNEFNFQEFSTLTFTKEAFNANLETVLNDQNTKAVENLGYLCKQSPQDNALKFSEEVCVWGRGQRVWANLKRLNKSSLEQKLINWLNQGSTINNFDYTAIKNTIKVGDDIPGLGVSFASKHLRMLNPNVFPVLDDVLAQGLGFALNENGYVLFIKNINSFKNQQETLKQIRIADIEMVLFLLVRQLVRSN
jgi:hypothetical protein